MFIEQPLHLALKHKVTIYLSSVLITLILQVFYLVFTVLSGRAIFDQQNMQEILKRVIQVHYRKRDQQKYFYRCTLFKIRGGWYTLGRWAGVVSRSNGNQHKSRSIFSINDADPKLSTGTVGKCFFAEGNMIHIHLNPEGEEQKYLAESWLTDVELRRLKTKSREYLATGVRKKGKLWGFIVVDTDDPSTKRSQDKESFDAFAMAIRHLID